MNKNLQIAIKASLAAGKEIMEVYDTAFAVDFKDDNSPLTEADKKANNIINSYLVPSKIPIISEENKQTDFSIRKHWETCWIVDPLDGTKEFVKRNGEFTVNIALVTQGKPVLGVIYVPVTQTLYYSDIENSKSFKASLTSHDVSLERVQQVAKAIHPKITDNKLVKIVGSRSHMNPDTLDFIEKLKFAGKDIEIVSKGSSLKFCIIAEGEADIYPRFAPTMEWDTAAGQAICEAVGINVISVDKEQKLVYNKENLLNSSFLVSK
ncbi:3'(2'),5'-bisphosphate nucleotidase CysQ [Bizionia sp.]|uniref:3'(2'),5'-bisphosphate nucleotidase CysQ n=1 Tax=Bizionia sp. TaxID=1954480 RepID=UPI003A8D5629